MLMVAAMVKEDAQEMSAVGQWESVGDV